MNVIDTVSTTAVVVSLTDELTSSTVIVLDELEPSKAE